MRPGEQLKFYYSGLLQKAEVFFSCREKDASGYEIICSANVKLPVLKKSFETKTYYEEELSSWSTHYPIVEKGSHSPEVQRTSDLKEEGVLDPVTFFMKIHRHEWSGAKAKLLVGKRIVDLVIDKNWKGYEISRQDKDQKVFLIMDGSGILALEIPVPVLGTLSLKRQK